MLELLLSKVRDLIRDLTRAGFVNPGGKGSHRKFSHPSIRRPVTWSGLAGDDANPYQERKISEAIKESQR